MSAVSLPSPANDRASDPPFNSKRSLCDLPREVLAHLVTSMPPFHVNPVKKILRTTCRQFRELVDEQAVEFCIRFGTPQGTPQGAADLQRLGSRRPATRVLYLQRVSTAHHDALILLQSWSQLKTLSLPLEPAILENALVRCELDKVRVVSSDKTASPSADLLVILQMLQNCVSLRHLSLSNLRQIQSYTAECWHALGQLTQLVTLEVMHLMDVPNTPDVPITPATNTPIAAINCQLAQLTGLTRLHTGWAPRGSDVTPLTNLQSLSFYPRGNPAELKFATLATLTSLEIYAADCMALDISPLVNLLSLEVHSSVSRAALPPSAARLTQLTSLKYHLPLCARPQDPALEPGSPAARIDYLLQMKLGHAAVLGNLHQLREIELENVCVTSSPVDLATPLEGCTALTKLQVGAIVLPDTFHGCWSAVKELHVKLGTIIEASMAQVAPQLTKLVIGEPAGLVKLTGLTAHPRLECLKLPLDALRTMHTWSPDSVPALASVASLTRLKIEDKGWNLQRRPECCVESDDLAVLERLTQVKDLQFTLDNPGNRERLGLIPSTMPWLTRLHLKDIGGSHIPEPVYGANWKMVHSAMQAIAAMPSLRVLGIPVLYTQHFYSSESDTDSSSDKGRDDSAVGGGVEVTSSTGEGGAGRLGGGAAGGVVGDHLGGAPSTQGAVHHEEGYAAGVAPSTQGAVHNEEGYAAGVAPSTQGAVHHEEGLAAGVAATIQEPVHHEEGSAAGVAMEPAERGESEEVCLGTEHRRYALAPIIYCPSLKQLAVHDWFSTVLPNWPEALAAAKALQQYMQEKAPWIEVTLADKKSGG